MSTVVESLLRSGLAPRRLRNGLRRATAPLQASATASLGGTARLAVRIPLSILGAELADAMGDTLRKALRFWDEPHVDDSTSTAVRERIPALVTRHAEAAGGRARALPTPLSGNRATGPELAAHAGMPSGGRRTSLPMHPATPDSAPRRVPEDAETLGRRRGSAGGPREGESPLTRWSRADAAPTTRAAVPPAASPLTAALRAYWTRSSAAETGRGEPGVLAEASRVTNPVRDRGRGPAAHANERGGRVVPTPVEATSSPARAWPADATPACSPLTTDRRVGLGSPAGALPESSRPVLSMPTTPDWLLGDLADQLADILREQAIDQGVDLT